MIQLCTVGKLLTKPKPGKESRNNWKNTLFYSSPSQYNTLSIQGGIGQGKSSVAIQIIHELGDKKKSQIMWVSQVAELDGKVQELAKNWNVQFFNQKDCDDGLFEKLYEYLKQKRQDMTKREEKEDKYVRNFIVFDDVVLTQKNMNSFLILMKCARHVKTFVISITQDEVQQFKKQVRSMFTAKIYFGGLSNDRMKNIAFKEIKGLDIDFNTFNQIYRHATAQPHNFLVISSRAVPTVLQKNFNQLYFISKEPKSQESESEEESEEEK